jgi:hypothetical protein
MDVANEIKSSLDKYTHILNHKSKRRRVSYDSSTILYEEEEENSEYRFCEDMKIKKENEKKRIERVKADEEKIENQKLDIDSKVKIAKSSRRVIIELKYRKKDDTCALCMEDMENKKVQHTPCGHSFHMSCLDKQFTEYKDYRCSLCRYQIYEPEYVPDHEYSYTFRNAFRLTDNSYLEALAEIADAEWNANNAYVPEEPLANEGHDEEPLANEGHDEEPLANEGHDEEPLANEGHDEESKQHSMSQDEIKLVTSEEDDNSLSDEIITTIAFIVYQHRRINIQLQQVIEETMRVERQTEELARALALGDDGGVPRALGDDGGVPREESVRLRGRRRVRMRELRRAIIDVLRNI